jgi:hypothetical protein
VAAVQWAWKLVAILVGAVEILEYAAARGQKQLIIVDVYHRWVLTVDEKHGPKVAEIEVRERPDGVAVKVWLHLR